MHVARSEFMAFPRARLTVDYALYLTKTLFIIFFFFRCGCILARMRIYAATLFLVVVVVGSWYVVEEEDL